MTYGTGGTFGAKLPKPGSKLPGLSKDTDEAVEKNY